MSMPGVHSYVIAGLVAEHWEPMRPWIARGFGGHQGMKKGIAIAGAALALAAAAYVGVWFHGAGRFERALAEWKEGAEGEGLTITHDALRVGGFPFELTAVLSGLRIRNEAAGASLNAAPIRLRTTLWNPDRVEYDIAGKHAITVHQGVQGTQATLDFETGIGEVVLDGERRIDRLAASNLRIVADEGIMTVETLELNGTVITKPADPTAESFRSIYTIAGVSVSNLLGVRMIELPVEQLRLELAATGPFMEIFQDGTLVDWAEAAGVLTLHDLTLEWGGLALTATGSGSFDSQLRFSGAMTLVSSGFEEGLTALEERGVMPLRIGHFVRQMTQRFIVRPAGGGTSQLIVPLTASDGVLSMGGEPLAVIPSLSEL